MFRQQDASRALAGSFGSCTPRCHQGNPGLEATASDTFADQLRMPLEESPTLRTLEFARFWPLFLRDWMLAQFGQVTVFSADIHLSPWPFQTRADPRGQARDGAH